METARTSCSNRTTITTGTQKPSLFQDNRTPHQVDYGKQHQNVSHATSDSQHTAIIIGAGLGGLATGIHLANAGWKVTILEKNNRCGGRMNIIEENGFRIDMGPTMLMMPEVIEQLFQSCGRKMEDYLTLTRLQPSYTIHWNDGTHLDMQKFDAEFLQNASKIAPEDTNKLPMLMEAMGKKYQNARYNFIEQPFNKFTDLLRPDTLRGILRELPIGNVYDFVTKYIKNDKLRQAFTFQTLYLGISPKECPSIYALLPYIEMEFGVWFPHGGTYALAEALEKLFLELGGDIHYQTPVEQIIIKDKQAIGVQTTEGTALHANRIICNLDAPTAYQTLIPASERSRNTNATLARKQYGCSGYLLYLGVKKIPSEWGHNTILLSDDYEEALDSITASDKLSPDPAMHVCIPTRTDPTLAPADHDVVYILVPCPNTQSNIDWEKEAPAFRERILSKLERTGLPHLRENIVFEREFTPPMFQTLYGCYAGAAYSSLSPTFFQSAYFRPHNRSEDLDNLYFVGAGTHPGGGVPIVLTSGRLVAEAVLQDIHQN